MGAPRVAVVGGGIVGLAHAWSAAARGHRVTLFERHPAARGATVRNFGMVWPVGQPAGEPLAVALRSRDRWLELGRRAGLPVRACGALHLAHRPDEEGVLGEFAAVAPGLGYDCRLLTRDETLRLAPGAAPDGLRCALWSATELGVNPRHAAATLARWLAEAHGVTLRFGCEVARVGPGPTVDTRAASGPEPFDLAVVCTGSDFAALFPEEFRDAGLRPCKLQMLATGPQPHGWRAGPHLASGLTLRHYQSFRVCPGLAALARRVAAETPELDRFGVHVMASQTEDGRVILGDSHEYGADIEPFDKAVIDELMLRELRKVFTLPDWTVAERWHGVYAKCTEGFVLEREVGPGVHVCTGTGGAGMTLSFGIAERFWGRLTGGGVS